MVPGRCVPRIEGDRALLAREGNPDNLPRDHQLRKHYCVAAIRDDLSERILSAGLIAPADDAASGNGVADLRNGKRGRHRRQWSAVPLTPWLLLLIVLGLGGCTGHSQIPPAARYRDAQLKFQQGDLPGASQESEIAYKQLSAQNPELSWRFRVLNAEVLVWRGLSKDAIELLGPEAPAAFAVEDIGVRREIVLGLAYSYLQEFDEAIRHIDLAEQLANLHQPGLLGEVMLTRGTFSVLRHDYSSAEASFRLSLKIARQQNQTFLASKALGSLGNVTMREEHYDESIDWDDQALELSRSLGARIATAKILGNIGWDYYKMGDRETALEHFVQAEKDSAQLGLQRDQLIWLTNVGTVEYDERSYDSARRDFNAALVLAQGLENKALASACLNDLALVELSEGNYGEAERY